MLLAGVSALACSAADGTAPGFKLSSLVLPQGVSYELGPVTLTRTLDAATSASKTGSSSSKTQEESSGEKKTVGSGVESSRTSGHSSGANLGGSIGGSSGGGGGFSLMGLLGIHTDIGGKISSEDSSNQKSSDHNGTERVSESSRGSKSGSSSEFEEVEQYGQYHLKFSVTFKSKDLSDTFLVGGPNARVILNGFSAPVPVPYTERTDPVRLRAEERTFFFDYPIADQVTLRDAKRMVAQGRRNAVTLSLVGDEFPVVSERTKDNVVSEITRLMKLSPNTLVAVDFGDVKRLSPWRVRRKFTKASGRKGARVTVREAFLALNEFVAEDEEMPDETFAFASDGRLASVLDTSVIAPPRKGDVALVLVSATEDGPDGASEVHFPTKEFLDRPLADFAEMRLVTGSLAELAQAAAYVPEKAAALRAEVEPALASVPAAQKLWKDLLAKFEAEKAAGKPRVEEAKKSGPGEAGATRTITLPGGATMELCWCPPGSFMMGSPASEQGRDSDELLHKVTLTKGFWLGKYEVTQRQWESVMGANSSTFRSPDRPVENVSWEDCQKFIHAVQRAAPELRPRLPTEAEWEYACRAGTETALPNGRDLVIRGDNNGPALDDIAWYGGNSSVDFELSNGTNTTDWKEKQYPGGYAGTHPVGRKAANAWGLHDMIGNVWEWCADCYDSGFYSTSRGDDPQCASGSDRVCRGGCWGDGARNCRSADRDRLQPSDRDDYLGFRLCCSAGPRD